MATATSLTQALDNRGMPYYAVRPGTVQLFTTTTGSGVNSAAFQPTTKVIRVTTSTDLKVTFPGGAIGVVSPGSFQDFIVAPTDTLSFQALTAAGVCSVAELI